MNASRIALGFELSTIQSKLWPAGYAGSNLIPQFGITSRRVLESIQNA
jgi:hypothetical protein